MKILDLGCGKNLYPNSIGVDIDRESDAHIICNVGHYPYPFKDNIFNMIISKQVFEHLEDVEKTLKEIHRISKNKAKVIIEGPHFSCYLGYGDPTHRRTFSIFSFDQVAPKCGFNILDRKLTFHKSFRKYKLNILANALPRWYERFWAFILPAEYVHFELEVVK